MHLTTLSHWAFVGDCLLVFLYFKASDEWEDDSRSLGFLFLACWMFISKFIKLVGHYIRYPADFLLLPVSIIFGYLHGLIKVYAMLSLNVVRRNLHLVAPYRIDASSPRLFRSSWLSNLCSADLLCPWQSPQLNIGTHTQCSTSIPHFLQLLSFCMC